MGTSTDSLTVAVQNRRSAFTAAYRTATVREPVLFGSGYGTVRSRNMPSR